MLPVKNQPVQANLLDDLHRYAALAALMLLAGCAATTLPTAVDVAGPELDAQALAAEGNVEAALAIYADLYASALGPERARWALEAAELLVDAGASTDARTWLQRAEIDAAPSLTPRLTALNADLSLLDGNATEALDWLDRLDADIDRPLALRVFATRGRALFRVGRVEEAVRVLVERDIWLDSDTAILANHDMIWSGLRAQPAGTAVVATGDRIVDGWLALLPVAIASRNDPSSLAAHLDAWYASHPTHPAVQWLLPELRERDRLAQTYPARVALLLPLRSLPEESAAIRDGFMAAFLRSPSVDSMALKIYDTDENGSQQAYLQAQTDGAEFIVGPLLKPDIEALVPSAGLVPTLALNTIDSPMQVPQNLFQFGLAPEDEAAEAARHAIANGARTAVALFPNSQWGLRLFDSFQREFVARGGRVLESRAYDTSTQDFSLAITTLLNLNDSTQRRQRLAANLGTTLEFEPRRRQDVDMIFFGADPRIARLLAPQFRFHFAGDLPTYATSLIYDATTATDPDLNGVIFADTPWLLEPDAGAVELRETLRRFWPQRTTRWLRLYGLGFDAYRVIPPLFNGTAGFASVPGMSGELWLDPQGRVRRRLPIAQFVDGKPVPLVPDPTTTTDGVILSQR